MGSSSPRTRPLLCAVMLGAAVAALLCTGDALAGSSILAQARSLESFERVERIQTILAETLTTFYFLAFGGTVGSFINVVVYRSPRGLGLLWPPSRCPVCETRIRATDNLPVIGWLRLGGRCRNCNAAISSRYPLVEAGVGLMFLALAYGEIMSGGANLPVRPPNRHAGALWTMWAVEWDLIGFFLFHVFLLCTLATLALVKLDRQPTPLGVVLTAFLVGMVAPQVWPWLQPVGWRFAVASDGSLASAAPRLTGVVGLCVGVALGAALANGDRRTARGQRSREGLRSALGLAGLWLGWQAALSIGLASAVVRRALRLVAPSLAEETPPTMVVWAVTLWQLLAWRMLSDWVWWPGPASGVGALIAGIALLALLSWPAPPVSAASTPDWANAAARLD